MKKPLQEFLDAVIIPLENSSTVADGNLYISIKTSHSRMFNPAERSIDSLEAQEWKLIDGKPSEEWNNFNAKIHNFHHRIALHSLSTLLFSKQLTENLFIAEYDEPFENLKYEHLLRRSDLTLKDNDVNEIVRGSLKHYSESFDSLPKGIYTAKARIVRPIEKWSYKGAWQFSIDCVERAISAAKKNLRLNNEGWPSIYDQAMDYAQKFMTWTFNKEELGNLNYYTKFIGDKLNKRYIPDKDKNIIEEMYKWADKNKHLNCLSLAEALEKCMSGWDSLSAVKDARDQIGKFRLGEYSTEYDIPTYAKDADTFERILYALRKEEFNWQIQHLTTFTYD